MAGRLWSSLLACWAVGFCVRHSGATVTFSLWLVGIVAANDDVYKIESKQTPPHTHTETHSFAVQKALNEITAHSRHTNNKQANQPQAVCPRGSKPKSYARLNNTSRRRALSTLAPSNWKRVCTTTCTHEYLCIKTSEYICSHTHIRRISIMQYVLLLAYEYTYYVHRHNCQAHGTGQN